MYGYGNKYLLKIPSFNPVLVDLGHLSPSCYGTSVDCPHVSCGYQAICSICQNGGSSPSCLAGSYSNGACTGSGTSDTQTCVACDSGQYQPSNTYAGTSCQPHTVCGNQVGGGTRLTGATSTAAGSCNACASNTYASNGGTNCQANTNCGTQVAGGTQ